MTDRVHSDGTETDAAATQPGSFRQVVAVFTRDRMATAGLIIVILFYLIALFAPILAPYPDEGAGKPNASALTQPPSAENIMGTDQLGRDVLSRIIIGARPTLLVPLVVVALAILVGAPLGAIAGFRGGWVDTVIMRTTDLFLSFPSLLLAIAITAALGRGLFNAALALVISWWPWYTRLVRGVAVSVRQSDFVEAAEAIGLTKMQIVRKHILPNSVTPIVVQATIDLGIVIIAMGGLAFLGLGTQPPSPDWGLMISEGRSVLLSSWWVATFPGIAIFIVVFCFNVIGDALRDVFDPRTRR
ncbi:MAG: ABC transporter permease [Actinomycetia bacterium]|nr:ABC transporter permease [Actinomycetes bacterium]